MTILKAACTQMNSGPDLNENLEQAEALIRCAVGEGAQLIATPENTCRMRANIEDRLLTSWDDRSHPALSFFRNLAAELKVALLIGSLSSVKLANNKLANRSYLINDDGEIAAHYDKIHLFDVDLENRESYRESATCQPGDVLAVSEIFAAQIGLSVCYDLRFPHIYREMAKAGAQILSIPAAFTVPTGQAHWEILLRARAIENGAFVLAPAQCGLHEGGRATWGHSMIISPWGDILAQLDDKPGIIMADLDLSLVDKARAAIPALRHDRPYKGLM